VILRVFRGWGKVLVTHFWHITSDNSDLSAVCFGQIVYRLLKLETFVKIYDRKFDI